MKNLKDHMGYIVKYRVHSRVTHQVGDQAWHQVITQVYYPADAQDKSSKVSRQTREEL